MLQILDDFIKEKKNACIYTNAEDIQKFIYGSIICADDDFFAVSMISPDGDFDGVLVKQTAAIIYLETDEQYDNKMKKLSASKPTLFTKELEKGNIPRSLLSISLETKQVVSIELINSGIDNLVGIVIDIKNNICVIEEIDDYGISFGKAYFDISDITEISYASQDEKRILKLMG